MTALERRLRSLALGEWCCALFLPFLAIVVVGRGAWTAANLTGAAVLAGILLVGGTYWWLKLRQVRAHGDRPTGLAAFAVYRWLGWVLGAAGVVVALLQWGDPWREWVPGLLMALFALVEQVNYFVVQLAVARQADWERFRREGFRRSWLADDLSRRTAPSAPR